MEVKFQALMITNCAMMYPERNNKQSPQYEASILNDHEIYDSDITEKGACIIMG